MPPSSGWSVWAQRLHHADLKQRPVRNCKAQGWGIRGKGGPWKWHIALQIWPTARASDRKKLKKIKRNSIWIYLQQWTLVSIERIRPISRFLRPFLDSNFFWRLYLSAFPTIPYTLTSNTRGMDCEVRNVPFVKGITVFCDVLMWCGWRTKTVLSCSGQITGTLFCESALKVVFSQALRYTFTRMYGVTYQNNILYSLLQEDRSFKVTYFSEFWMNE